MGEDNKSEMPPFASGKIVPTYKPLYIYWRLLKDDGREDLLEKSVLKEEDYKRVKELSEQNMNVEALINALKQEFRERIDPDYAKKALESYGLQMPAEEAVDMLAFILAGWSIEAAEQWNFIKLRNDYE